MDAGEYMLREKQERRLIGSEATPTHWKLTEVARKCRKCL